MDTREHRASAFGFALAALVILPVADGTLDQGDRQQVAFSYRGILAGAAVPPPEGIVVTREQLAVCTVTELLVTASVREALTVPSVTED